MAFSPKVQYILQSLKCCSVSPLRRSKQEAFILHFSCSGNTSQFISPPLFYTILFTLLIKTVKWSVVSAAAMQDLEVVSVWFLCNIIFMFILFFLVDYIQDASWLTDGDAFTRVFFFFFIKKNITRKRRRKDRNSCRRRDRQNRHTGHWVTWGSGRRTQHMAQGKKKLN